MQLGQDQLSMEIPLPWSEQKLINLVSNVQLCTTGYFGKIRQKLRAHDHLFVISRSAVRVRVGAPFKSRA